MAILAQSRAYALLGEENLVVVTTESLNGTYRNRTGTINGWRALWYTTTVVCKVMGSFFLGLLTA